MFVFNSVILSLSLADSSLLFFRFVDFIQLILSFILAYSLHIFDISFDSIFLAFTQLSLLSRKGIIASAWLFLTFNPTVLAHQTVFQLLSYFLRVINFCFGFVRYTTSSSGFGGRGRKNGRLQGVLTEHRHFKEIIAAYWVVIQSYVRASSQYILSRYPAVWPVGPDGRLIIRMYVCVSFCVCVYVYIIVCM